MTCPTKAGTVGGDTATTQLVAAGSCDNDHSDVVATMVSPSDTGSCEVVDVDETLQLSDAGSGANHRQTSKMPHADAAFSVDATTDELIGDVAVVPSPPPPWTTQDVGHKVVSAKPMTDDQWKLLQE